MNPPPPPEKEEEINFLICCAHFRRDYLHHAPLSTLCWFLSASSVCQIFQLFV